ncbi:MAG: hypothetical protein U1E05_01560 [Patescibacteria group bacterium]|nr:hypothetical protein [Patescibacteria group bacterium]
MKSRTVKALKWSGIAVVSLGLLYAVLLGLASRSLHRAYQALEADGRPMRLAEIVPPAIPDADNAALVYQAVVLLLRSEPAGEKDLFTQLDDFAAKMLDDPSDAEAAASFRKLSRNEVAMAVRETIERGTLKPGCRYELDYSQGAGMLLPHLAHLRSLSRILCATARVQAADGDHTGAWRTVVTALRFADAVKEEPILVSQLVRLAQFKMAIAALQAVAAQAVPSDSQAAEMAALLKSFDDHGPLVASLDGERLALGEWAFGLGSDARQTLEIPSWGVTLATFVRPLLRYDHAAYLGVMHAYAKNAVEPHSASDAELGDDLTGNVPRYCVLTRLLVPALSTIKVKFVATTAESRVTRAGLAVLRHRVEHGVYPATLAELSIQSLIDPFSQRTLIYRPGPHGFTLYSIGKNMTDDGGTPAKKGDTRSGDTHSGDIVWQYGEPGGGQARE